MKNLFIVIAILLSFLSLKAQDTSSTDGLLDLDLGSLYSPSDKHNLKALVSFWGNRPSFADNYQTLQYELHSVPYTSIQSTELSYFWQPNDKWNLNVNVFANIIGGVPSRHLDSLDSGGTLIHFHAFKEKRTLFWITDLLINFILM